MANDIINVIKVTENIEEFKKAILTNDSIVDFNLVKPMSKDLEVERSLNCYQPDQEKQKADMLSIENGTVATKLIRARACIQDQLQLMLENFYKEDMSQDEFVEAVLDETVNSPYWEVQDKVVKEVYASKEDELQKHVELLARSFYNFQKHGHTDWYDWSRANWGTKWNADPDSVVVSENENGLYLEFMTTWTSPSKVYVELAKKFNFEVAYADMNDKGSYLGTITFKNQEVTLHEFDQDERLTEDDCYFLADKISGDGDECDESSCSISKERQELLTELVAPILM